MTTPRTDEDLLVPTYGSFRDSSVDQRNVTSIRSITGDDHLVDAMLPPTADETIADKDGVNEVLPVWRKLAYGAGGPPMQMLSNSMAFFFTIFLLETAGINPYYNSVIQFSARAWDAFTDPLIGYLVTKTRTRFGRMRPWLILSAPFGCLAFFLLFYVPDISSDVVKFVYYLFAIMFLQTTLTTFHVPYSSMTMVLTANPKDRDLCSAYRMAFELLGVLVGVGVFGVIINQHRVISVTNCEYNISRLNETTSQRDLQKIDYMIASSVLGGIFILCASVVFFGSREKNIVLEKRENYIQSLKKILSFKPYLKLMFAFLFISLGLQTVQGNLALFITHSMQLPAHMNSGILVILVTAIALIPVAQLIIVRFGKKTAFAAGVVNMIPVLMATVFVPPQPHLALFYAVMVVSGFTISISFLLPWSMLPDVIDDFMLKYGVRREAAFYSFYVFFNKFAVGISVGCSSVILGLVGYKEDSDCQDASVGIALRYLVGPTALVFFILSLIVLYFYPINERYRKFMRTQLERLRVEQERVSVDRSCTTLVSTIDCKPENNDLARRETLDMARKYTENDIAVSSTEQLSSANNSTRL